MSSTYRVRAGDTLGLIATRAIESATGRRFSKADIPARTALINQIAADNHLDAKHSIKPGLKLIIPASGAAAAPTPDTPKSAGASLRGRSIEAPPVVASLAAEFQFGEPCSSVHRRNSRELIYYFPMGSVVAITKPDGTQRYVARNRDGSSSEVDPNPTVKKARVIPVSPEVESLSSDYRLGTPCLSAVKQGANQTTYEFPNGSVVVTKERGQVRHAVHAPNGEVYLIEPIV